MKGNILSQYDTNNDLSVKYPIPTQDIFLHKSATDATNIVRYYGTIQDVPGDGSCRYHPVMLLLHKLNVINNDLSISQFCRGIFNFIQTNMKKFVGTTNDGSNCAAQYPWGRRSSTNPIASWERFMTMEVMKGIWNYGTDYTKFVLYGNWVDAQYLLPAIGYMYKIPRLVMYDNRQMMDGSRQLTTYVYTYDRNISSMSCEIRPGSIHHINPSGNACYQ
jgi:hypothetical protein